MKPPLDQSIYPVIRTSIKNRHFNILIDSGAASSHMTRKLFDGLGFKEKKG